jgi:type I restriction enzyme S subunit
MSDGVWKKITLGNATQKIADRDHFTPVYVEHGVPMISPKDFDENGRLDFSRCQFIAPAAHRRNRRKTDITVGDIVFTRIGARLGKAALVTREMPEFSLLHSAVMIRPDSPTVLSEYLVYVMKGHELQSQIGKEIQSIGVPDLGLDKIAAFEITLPPLPQQRKIAKILTTVDNLIEKTEALIAKYQAIKQGMMHDLFTRGVDEHGHLRPPCDDAPELYKESELGWIPKEWGVDIINNVLDRIIDYRGKTPTKTESGIPLITAKNIRMGFIDEEPQEYISEGGYESWMTRGIPRRGNVLFTTEAPLGNVAQITTDQRLAFAQRVIILQCNARMRDGFLKYLLMNERSRSRVFAKGTGSTVEGIKQSVFRLIPVAFPQCVREQQAIVEQLIALEQQVVHEQAILRKYALTKTGLMQDLLTGKIPVKVDGDADV